MTATMHNMRDRLDGWLWRLGYDHPEIRELVRWTVVMAALIVVCSVPLSLFWQGAWSLVAGTVIITANFCSMAKFGQHIADRTFTAKIVISLLFGFYLRLALTGAALYACIAWFDARPLPLVAGTTTVVGIIVIWGLVRYADTRARQTLRGKEA